MDIESLNVATLIELEERSGLTLSEVMAKAQAIDITAGQLPPAKVLGALSFIAARIADPAATWDEAITRPLSDLSTLADLDGGGDQSPED